ncbi:Alcohol dehydrogenase superfamily [Cinnamomum micranthum f. kanehirae]|uniref:Alcohol dehydrogenase superfamily n=1 Tax=Cinnamomum micranthum f. kanehirae TaxID=337451 RepID=A0A443PB90_9MAGN|nr:Alcohol dehydrogenase superfamily [Cinnamomum micranthum f. kanehirae]
MMSAGVALASGQLAHLVERNIKVFNNNADSSIGMKFSTPAQGGRKPQSRKRRGPDKDRGATALNRADTLQRKGSSPPPEGASPYPDLECAGTVESVGENVTRWTVGDEVCALLSGGGYAEKVAVPADKFFQFHEIHGGSSGIGTFAIQIAKHQGVRVFVTAGSEEKLTFCKELGTDVCINYKTEDFVACLKEETGGKGVDVILDNVGGPYFQRNLNSLNVNGRLFIIGFQGGTITVANLGCMLAKAPYCASQILKCYGKMLICRMLLYEVDLLFKHLKVKRWM